MMKEGNEADAARVDRGQCRTGKRRNNPVLLTEGRVTLVDAALAGMVLLSLGLTQWLGWWWADAAGELVLMDYCC